MEAYPGTQVVEQNVFDGIRLNTCANKYFRYVSNTIQDIPNKVQFKSTIKLIYGKQVKFIERFRKSLGESIVQLTFKYLNIIITFNFIILPENIPSLLSMKYVMDNGFDPWIQRQK